MSPLILISTPLFGLVRIPSRLIRCKVWTLKADPRARSMVSLSVSFLKFKDSVGPHSSSIFSTIPTSQVELYLGVVGLSLKTALKNLLKDLPSTSLEFIYWIADLKLFKVWSEPPSLKRFVRHFSTTFSSAQKGLWEKSVQNAHQYFSEDVYCLMEFSASADIMMVIVSSDRPLLPYACLTQLLKPGKASGPMGV